MPRYVIEREMPDLEKMTEQDLHACAVKSCEVLRKLSPDVQWVHSYVTADKVYCVYHASNEQVIRRHAEEAGLPATSIKQVRAVMDPATAEPAPV